MKLSNINGSQQAGGVREWTSRKVFGPPKEEVTGHWGKLRIEELHDFYSSPNIVRVTKSRRIRWAGHVARMRDVEILREFRL